MTRHTAELKYLRMAPRKVRAVANVVKGLPVGEAEAQLALNRRRAAVPVLKLLRSAEAGAKERKLDAEKLYVQEIRVDRGPMLKRYMPRARGSASMIQKKMSHVTLTLNEGDAPFPRRFTIVKKEKTPKEKRGDKKGKRPQKPMEEHKEPKEKKTKGLSAGRQGFFRRTFGRKSGDL